MWGAGQLLTNYLSQTGAPPSSFYLALICDTPPDPYNDGTELDEPPADDYARIEIVNDRLNWSNENQTNVVMNLLPAQFITSVTDWGKINYWALCDSPVDGNNLLVGLLDTPVYVNAGDQVVIDVGDISMSLGPFFMVDEQ